MAGVSNGRGRDGIPVRVALPHGQDEEVRPAPHRDNDLEHWL